MKKIMMIAAMMVATMSVSAQEAGQMFVKPMVGGTLSTWTGDVHNLNFRLGLVGGAEFGYHVSDPFAITAGALVAMEGTNIKDKDNVSKDGSITTTYLNVPILANYYIAKGLAIKAGIQPGFLLSLKNKIKEYSNGTWIDHESTSTTGFNKFDLSIPMGISYEISDFVIDARYNLDLVNMNKDKDGTVKNAVIMLTVGYKINL